MKKRVFIAINLPTETKDELGQLLKKLKKINPQQQIRYVKADSLHLTLHFLGDRGAEEISTIKKVMRDIASSHSPSTIITGDIDAFPNLQSPKVVYLSIMEKPKSSISSLQKKLGFTLEQAGIDVDHRAWQPHLTLARINSPTVFKTQNAFPPIIEIPATHITLMESNLTSYGAQYTVLESFSFSNHGQN
ncbi:MAG: RNA 2',3'-cyclic phosphodiesterase [Candidatus Buchananbacteria bacterium]|nr:RNA 2',3'-cyclic phosphodiesterase [Candidatus Buchananbacteria bacterium]